MGVVFWYVFIFLLGLFAYPMARSALAGFRSMRIRSAALLAGFARVDLLDGGSVGMPYTRVSISVAFAIIAVAGFGLWMMRRDQFKAEWNSSRKFFTLVEIIFLASS